MSDCRFVYSDGQFCRLAPENHYTDIGIHPYLSQETLDSLPSEAEAVVERAVERGVEPVTRYTILVTVTWTEGDENRSEPFGPFATMAEADRWVDRFEEALAEGRFPYLAQARFYIDRLSRPIEFDTLWESRDAMTFQAGDLDEAPETPAEVCPECECRLNSPECHSLHGCDDCEGHFAACWADTPLDQPLPKDGAEVYIGRRSILALLADD
jgi:hypothetical protein